MFYLEIISPRTNTALREAAAHYSASVLIPCYVEGVGGFAGAYLGATPHGVQTLVTTREATPATLAVTVADGDDKHRAFINIDLNLPDQHAASIVAPGIYAENGERSAKGILMRPVVRLLTDTEGLGLTGDLYTIMAKLPSDRRKR